MTFNPLVSTQWLHDHLADPDLRMVDIRGHVLPATEPLPHYFNHHTDYVQAHIPGAVFVDWVREITDPDDPRHAQIAQPERYAAVMSRLGIAPETLVVAYDDADGMFAARLWWSLLYYRHEKVVILDGGWKKWTVEGRPVTAEVPEITPSLFVAHPNEALRRTGAQVSAALHQVTLLDLRSPAEYNGQASRAQRAGHIPGAINLPRTDLVRGDGTLLRPDELRRRFAALGLDETSEIITYCNGGVSASFGMLTLRVAGLDHVSMYDGSWKEWGNASDKPVES